ncbi:MAG: hypothetical protein HY081_06235 [Gammaproteobacteria bacterium]|nr:hypothetical protein [Gammaproteobacteria bacterium]
MSDTTSVYTETEHRLHATVRVLLSPGIWLVLGSQIALLFSLQWRAPQNTTPVVSALTLLMTLFALMLFFYLQASAFYALTRDKNPLTIKVVVSAGKEIFAAFLLLTLKAGLLLMLILNVSLYIAMLITGHDLQTVVNAIAPFGVSIGLLAFIFVYWLPYVFVHREFRLFTSLRRALKIAWTRLAHCGFLALLVIAPIVVSELLPAASPAWLDLSMSVLSGLLSWIAYLYCVQVLQQNPTLGAAAA